MTIHRAIRPWATALLSGALCLLSACDSAATKSSGETEAVAIPETADAYRARSEELRHQGKAQEASDAALKAYVLAGTGPRVAERIELAKTHAARAAAAKAANKESDHAKAVSGAINEIVSLEKERREQGLAVDEVEIAEVYALIGNPDAVFRWLGRAVEAKSPNLAGIAANKDLEPVKTDPRWADFIAKLPK